MKPFPIENSRQQLLKFFECIAHAVRGQSFTIGLNSNLFYSFSSKTSLQFLYCTVLGSLSSHHSIPLRRDVGKMHLGALVKAVLVLPLLQSTEGQEDLPAWLFKATLVDTLHLPPGAQGSDLLADATFREFVRNLFSGAMVLPMFHIPPSAFTVENATVLEDVYAEAINAHGGVGHGKKSVRFEAVLSVASRAVSSSGVDVVRNISLVTECQDWQG